MDMIAYGLTSEDVPFVPEFVILEGEGKVVTVFRNAREDLSPKGFQKMFDEGKVALLGNPVPWREDSWPAVEADGLRWFFLSDEKRWRGARAKSLLHEAQGVSGDPVRKLSLLTASGNMGKVDVPKLVSSLEERRKDPSESLLDIYRRLEQEREA